MVEDLVAEHDILAALRRDSKAKVVDTLHRFRRRVAAVKRKRRKNCQMIACARRVTFNRTRQRARLFVLLPGFPH